MKDTALVILTLAALALIAVGALANSRRYEKNLKSPGAYYTGGMLCFVPVAIASGAPALVVAFNLVVLMFTVAMWAVDVNTKGVKP